MMRALQIFRLRLKLWRIYGVPFGPTVPLFRVGIRKVNKGALRGEYLFVNCIDGETRKRTLGSVRDLSIGEACKMARDQWADVMRRPDPPPADGPSPWAAAAEFLESPTDADRHEKMYDIRGGVAVILCSCGWTSIPSIHMLHPQDVPCADCAPIHQAYADHVATTQVQDCPCREFPEAPPNASGAWICGRCGRASWGPDAVFQLPGIPQQPDRAESTAKPAAAPSESVAAGRDPNHTEEEEPLS